MEAVTLQPHQANTTRPGRLPTNEVPLSSARFAVAADRVHFGATSDKALDVTIVEQEVKQLINRNVFVTKPPHLFDALRVGVKKFPQDTEFTTSLLSTHQIVMPVGVSTKNITDLRRLDRLFNSDVVFKVNPLVALMGLVLSHPKAHPDILSVDLAPLELKCPTLYQCLLEKNRSGLAQFKQVLETKPVDSRQTGYSALSKAIDVINQYPDRYEINVENKTVRRNTVVTTAESLNNKLDSAKESVKEFGPGFFEGVRKGVAETWVPCLIGGGALCAVGLIPLLHPALILGLGAFCICPAWGLIKGISEGFSEKSNGDIV